MPVFYLQLRSLLWTLDSFPHLPTWMSNWHISLKLLKTEHLISFPSQPAPPAVFSVWVEILPFQMLRPKLWYHSWLLSFIPHPISVNTSYWLYFQVIRRIIFSTCSTLASATIISYKNGGSDLLTCLFTTVLGPLRYTQKSNWSYPVFL